MTEDVQEEVESGEAGGGVLKKYGPLAFIVLIAQVVLAWGIVTFVLQGQIPNEAEEEQLETDYQVSVAQEDGENVLPYYFSPLELAKIAINPSGTNADRIAQFSVTLGLVATNTDEDKPEDRDITGQLAEKTELALDKITPYLPRIKAVVREVMSSKTMDELEPEFEPLVRDEIKDRLNREIFKKIFKIGEENKIEVKVQDVRFIDLVMM